MKKINIKKKNTDLSKILLPFENQWVALSPDHSAVVSSGTTLQDASAKVPDEERGQVVFFKVLPFNAYYEPTQV